MLTPDRLALATKFVAALKKAGPRTEGLTWPHEQCFVCTEVVPKESTNPPP